MGMFVLGHILPLALALPPPVPQPPYQLQLLLRWGGVREHSTATVIGRKEADRRGRLAVQL